MIVLQEKHFKFIFIFIPLSMFVMCSNAVAVKDFYSQKPKGFVWYKEESVRKKDKTKQKEEGSNSISSARTRNKALSKKFDEAVQVMIDNPNVENAIKAQRAQKLIMDRSEKVSNVWTLAALLDAGLLTKEDNQNVLHRELHKQESRANKVKKLKKMSQDWGILFYWTRGCIYCKRFIPIVKEMQELYDFQVLAVSKKGGNYGPFEGMPDTGLINKLNTQGFAPLLFLVNKDGEKIYPIARGLTDIDQIIENILAIKELLIGKA